MYIVYINIDGSAAPIAYYVFRACCCDTTWAAIAAQCACLVACEQLDTSALLVGICLELGGAIIQVTYFLIFSIFLQLSVTSVFWAAGGRRILEVK